MDPVRLRSVVEAIPPGRWMSYADVVAAAGGTPRQAIGVNARLTRAAAARRGRRRRPPRARADGSIAATRPRRPRAVRRLLVAEGLAFTAGRAAPAARLRPATPAAAGADSPPAP